MLLRRSLRTKGSRIALFAVWLIALSFGHIHPEDIFGPIGHAVAQGHGITQVASDRSAAPQGPSKHGAAAADTDGCAICASMMLAASTGLETRSIWLFRSAPSKRLRRSLCPLS